MWQPSTHGCQHSVTRSYILDLRLALHFNFLEFLANAATNIFSPSGADQFGNRMSGFCEFISPSKNKAKDQLPLKISIKREEPRSHLRRNVENHRMCQIREVSLMK